MDYILWGGGLILTIVVAAVLGQTATKVIEEYRRLAPEADEGADED
jgi:hypothetical protein